MSSYLSCGNIMSDIVVQPDGTKSERHMGGPAFFALSGIRLWTEDCKLVTGTGKNYTEDYEKWLDDNEVGKDAVRIEAERVTCYQTAYNDDGTINQALSFSYYGDENMGYLKTHPHHIEKAATQKTKGIYMAQGADRVVWEKLAEVKKKYGFKIMWELEYFNSGLDLERVKEMLPIADAWSLNWNEASGLFGIPRENDAEIITELQKLPVEFIFYRVGKRGAYAVTPEHAYFGQSVNAGPYVDQTGCGNCSTGAAMYAFVEGYSPQEILVMGNVASGYNCLQYGPYPLYTPQVRQKAFKLKEEYLPKVVEIT